MLRIKSIFNIARIGLSGSNYTCLLWKRRYLKTSKEHEPTTPTGEHTIIGMLYRPDRLKKPRDWAMPILINSFWSNDERDPDYNLMVSYSNTYCRKNYVCQRQHMILFYSQTGIGHRRSKEEGQHFSYTNGQLKRHQPMEVSQCPARPFLACCKVDYGTKITIKVT